MGATKDLEEKGCFEQEVPVIKPHPCLQNLEGCVWAHMHVQLYIDVLKDFPEVFSNGKYY